MPRCAVCAQYAMSRTGAVPASLRAVHTRAGAARRSRRPPAHAVRCAQVYLDVQYWASSNNTGTPIGVESYLYQYVAPPMYSEPNWREPPPSLFRVQAANAAGAGPLSAPLSFTFPKWRVRLAVWLGWLFCFGWLADWLICWLADRAGCRHRRCPPMRPALDWLQARQAN